MQYITSALKRRRETREHYTVSACKHPGFTQHIHAHTCARIVSKALLRRRTGGRLNPVLFFFLGLVQSGSELRCLGRSVRSLLGSLGVALHTQDLAVQWVAAVLVRLYGERASAVLRSPERHALLSRILCFQCVFDCVFVQMSYLTTVTLEVEVLVQGHDSDCLLAARCWHDGLVTAHTQRGETPEIKRGRGCQTHNLHEINQSK